MLVREEVQAVAASCGRHHDGVLLRLGFAVGTPDPCHARF